MKTQDSILTSEAPFHHLQIEADNSDFISLSWELRKSICEVPCTVAGTHQTFNKISILFLLCHPSHLNGCTPQVLRPPLPSILPMGRIFWDSLTWRRLPICVQDEKSKLGKAHAQYHFSPDRRYWFSCWFHSDHLDSSLFGISSDLFNSQYGLATLTWFLHLLNNLIATFSHGFN